MQQFKKKKGKKKGDFECDGGNTSQNIWLREDGDISGSQPRMASSLHGRTLTCTL